MTYPTVSSLPPITPHWATAAFAVKCANTALTSAPVHCSIGCVQNSRRDGEIGDADYSGRVKYGKRHEDVRLHSAA
jgi:hypothetical protein